MSKLLIVDDEPSICWGLSRLGESLGHEVTSFANAEQALSHVSVEETDLILLDVRLPGMDGLAALERLQQLTADVPVIVMTAHGDLQTAVEAVRLGATEYLLKPFDLDQVQRCIEQTLRERPRDVVPVAETSSSAMVGHSAALQEVFKRIALAAHSDAGVLLFGESGTGKELAARAIHNFSNRAAGPFVPVHMAALSETLAESELFGHVRGAFTGADHDRVGLLCQADGGTLFLDEVADIPLSAQVKLLRALDHHEVIPVGSSVPVTTRFRVISATHQDLTQKIREGTFRHDLYFRLGAFRIELPPLRQRLEDIPELASHFLQQYASSQDAAPSLSTEALSELQSRSWHGNIRELRNVLEHATIVARGGVINAEHLPPATNLISTQTSSVEPSAEQALAEAIGQWVQSVLSHEHSDGAVYEQLLRLLEPPLFKAALEKNQGQCAKAARQLGLHRTTLRKKLDQYQIDSEQT